MMRAARALHRPTRSPIVVNAALMAVRKGLRTGLGERIEQAEVTESGHVRMRVVREGEGDSPLQKICHGWSSGLRALPLLGPE
jgi:hypothetical protein